LNRILLVPKVTAPAEKDAKCALTGCAGTVCCWSAVKRSGWWPGVLPGFEANPVIC